MNCTRRRFLNRTSIAAAAGAGAPAWLLGGCAPALRLEAPSTAAADVARFDLGVASGHPSTIGMVLWTRLTGPGLPDRVDVRWELAHDEAFQRIAARYPLAAIKSFAFANGHQRQVRQRRQIA